MIVYGYSEKVNKIVVYQKSGIKFTRTLAINGINESEHAYSYYNKQDGLLHFVSKQYVKKIRLYHDKQFIMELTQD